MPPAQPLAIVTGASSGIGSHVAQRLAERGFRTVLLARRADRLEALAAELSRMAASVAVPVDLTDAAAVGPAFARILDEHGPARVLVNNAGFGQYGTFLDHELDDHRRLMEVHYFAAVSSIRAVLPAMLAGRRGNVVNVASMSTKVGPWGHAAYAAAKSALVSLTQTLAAEHEGSGVHFSYVNPGIVATDYFETGPLRAFYETVRARAIPPQRVAEAIVSLLDRPRLELCVPRHYRFLDWIRALHPELAHRVVASQSRPGLVASKAPSEARPDAPATPEPAKTRP